MKDLWKVDEFSERDLRSVRDRICLWVDPYLIFFRIAREASSGPVPWMSLPGGEYHGRRSRSGEGKTRGEREGGKDGRSDNSHGLYELCYSVELVLSVIVSCEDLDPVGYGTLPVQKKSEEAREGGQPIGRRRE